MMDHYVEQLVVKEKGAKEWGIIAGSVLVALALSVLSFIFLGAFFIIFTVGFGYAAYMLITAQTLEYEYCVTNGDIDIDSIIAKRKRKRIVSVRGSKIETMEPFTGEIPAGFDRTVMAAPSAGAAGCWRFTYHSKKNGHTQVIFQPSEAVLNELIGGLPRLLQIEVKRSLGR